MALLERMGCVRLENLPPDSVLQEGFGRTPHQGNVESISSEAAVFFNPVVGNAAKVLESWWKGTVWGPTIHLVY